MHIPWHTLRNYTDLAHLTLLAVIISNKGLLSSQSTNQNALKKNKLPTLLVCKKNRCTHRGKYVFIYIHGALFITESAWNICRINTCINESMSII